MTSPRIPPVEVPLRTFEDFFHTEYPELVAVGLAMTRDREAAEDAAQEAMRRAFERWSTVSGYDRPGAWTRRVAINLHLDRLRRSGSRTRALARLRPVPAADPATEIDGRIDFDALLAVLPPRQRAAIVAVYVADLSVADTAELLGCAEGTVKSQLSDARRTLARLVNGDVDGG